MRVHIIFEGELFLQQFIGELSGKYIFSVSVSSSNPQNLDYFSKVGISNCYQGTNADRITNDIQSIIVGKTINNDNPEVLKARELNIPIYSYGEFLYKECKMKTRVVITGHTKPLIIAMVLHTMAYHNRKVDYFTETLVLDKYCSLTDRAEFVLIEGNHQQIASTQQPIFLAYQPTLALIDTIESSESVAYQSFIDTLTKGGILIYNQQDSLLSSLVENTENQLRMLPYMQETYEINDQTTYLITSEGEIPLMIMGGCMESLSGAKWICQNMGVDEQDFYEAIATFEGVKNYLEKEQLSDNFILIKDNAQKPKEVQFSITTVKEQYPTYYLTACIEIQEEMILEELLSSSKVFNQADKIVIYTLLSSQRERIKEVFPHSEIYTDKDDFQSYIYQKNPRKKEILLFMSKDSYANIDFGLFSEIIASQPK